MKWIKAQDFTNFSLESSVWTIGNFDGLHLGHRQIVQSLIHEAQKSNSPSVVMGFDRHPKEVLGTQSHHFKLFQTEDLVEELRKMGVNYYLELPFTKELSELDPSTFFEDYVYKKIHPKSVVVGYDFGFGKDRTGDFNLIQDLSVKYGFSVKKIEPLSINDKLISSSRIRECLSSGRVDEVQIYLGRTYYIQCVVVHGSQMGRGIGFPTANMKINKGISLAKGVYQTQLEFNGQMYKSISNFGTRPTVNENQELYLETHVLNENLDLYNKSIKIHFERYLRPEKKFKNIDELKKQIQEDIQSLK